MYQWKIEDQQNLGMSTYRLPEILIRLKCSARCLPSWKPKHCPVELRSRSSSTLQNPATVYNFNSRVIFKHLKECLHNADNKRLGENAWVTRSCLFFFFEAFILTNNLEKKPRDLRPIEAGILKCFFSKLFFNCMQQTCKDHFFTNILSAGQHLICSIWFWPDSLTETKNLITFVREKVKVCYGLTTRLFNNAEVDLKTLIRASE